MTIYKSYAACLLTLYIMRSFLTKVTSGFLEANPDFVKDFLG